MDNIDQGLALDLFKSGLSDQQVASQLQVAYPGIRGLSERSVRRWKRDVGLRTGETVDEATAKSAVKAAALQIGPQSGRRYVASFLRAMGGPKIGENRVGRILKSIDPKNHACRRLGVSRRLNPRPYRANYFGDRIHMDQNEKIGMYGVTHVIGIDGHSGFIVGNLVLPVKNCITIYDAFFKPMLVNHGLWNQVIVDCGREFSLLLAVQQSLSDLRRDQSRKPFLQVQSTKNNRVERVWVEVNSRVNYPIKDAMNDMVDRGLVNMDNASQKFAVSLACCKIAHEGMVRLITARNGHRICNRGTPEVLRQSTDQTVKLSVNTVPDTDVAVASYRENRGTLTDPWTYGRNPQLGNVIRENQRDEQLSQFPFSPAEVYTFLINDLPGIFQEFVLHHVRTVSSS